MTAAGARRTEGRRAARNRPGLQGNRPRRKAALPLTPMIDVTFQLLLFFLLTFQFRQAEGQIPGTLPGTYGGPGPVVASQIDLCLRPSGPNNENALFEIRGEKDAFCSPAELFAKLHRRREDEQAASLVIHTRGDVRWLWAAEAFNQAVRAGIQKISFARAT